MVKAREPLPPLFPKSLLYRPLLTKVLEETGRDAAAADAHFSADFAARRLAPEPSGQAPAEHPRGGLADRKA